MTYAVKNTALRRGVKKDLRQDLDMGFIYATFASSKTFLIRLRMYSTSLS